MRSCPVASRIEVITGGAKIGSAIPAERNATYQKHESCSKKVPRTFAEAEPPLPYPQYTASRPPDRRDVWSLGDFCSALPDGRFRFCAIKIQLGPIV